MPAFCDLLFAEVALVPFLLLAAICVFLNLLYSSPFFLFLSLFSLFIWRHWANPVGAKDEPTSLVDAISWSDIFFIK